MIFNIPDDHLLFIALFFIIILILSYAIIYLNGKKKGKEEFMQSIENYKKLKEKVEDKTRR